MANNMNEYDQIKKMLNTVRRITESVPNKPLIQESPVYPVGNIEEPYNSPAEMTSLSKPPGDPDRVEGDDFAVINNLEVVFQGSSDPQDMVLKDDEKGKISQLVDDFRKEVSEMGEFNKLILAPSEAKLSGIIPDLNLPFMFSAGDKPGLSLGNIAEYTDEVNTVVSKLKLFQDKFLNTINDLLLSRREG